MTRDEAINILADEIRKRRDGCFLLLVVAIDSGVKALNLPQELSQEYVDEAFRRADEFE